MSKVSWVRLLRSRRGRWHNKIHMRLERNTPRRSPKAIDLTRLEQAEPEMEELLGLRPGIKKRLFEGFDTDRDSNAMRARLGSQAIDFLTLFPEDQEIVSQKIKDKDLKSILQYVVKIETKHADTRLEAAASLAVLFPEEARRMERSSFTPDYENHWNQYQHMAPGIPLSVGIERLRQVRTCLPEQREQPRNPEVLKRVRSFMDHVVMTQDWEEFLARALEATRYSKELRQEFMPIFETHRELIRGVFNTLESEIGNGAHGTRRFTKALLGYAVLMADDVDVSDVGELKLHMRKQLNQKTKLPARSEL